MNIKIIASAIIIAGLLIGGSIIFSGNRGNSNEPPPAPPNVSVVDGRQIIEMAAKGGYEPKITIAKADIATIIKMTTNGTFDCSAALTIPSLNYETTLNPSGVAEIKIPPQKAGTTLRGFCGMGMFNFAIKFN